jgi:release factor glutamine methyltransferase
MLETAQSTVRDVVRAAAVELAQAGCETPRLDAELLLCEALGSGWSRSRLIMADAQPLGSGPVARFEELLARRRAREPIAYILGRKDFRHISMAVDRRVLVPRPETELLVEVGLTLPSEARVADVGTGSGAVALALKHERPDLQVTGIDSSQEALAVARLNARRLDLPVEFVHADLLDGSSYDAVLANLPYVADGAAGELAPEIRSYEPAEALFAGSDGLDVIRRLLVALGGAAGQSVKLVGLEVAPGQAASVATLLSLTGSTPLTRTGSTPLRRTGFRSIDVLGDLAGHERVVVGRR